MFKEKFENMTFDENGYLQNFDEWNTDIAVFIAKREGIEQLNEEQWFIVNFLRNYYSQNKVCPTVRKTIEQSGIPLKKIYELFQRGLVQHAFKIAGLPKPDNCV